MLDLLRYESVLLEVGDDALAAAAGATAGAAARETARETATETARAATPGTDTSPTLRGPALVRPARTACFERKIARLVGELRSLLALPAAAGSQAIAALSARAAAEPPAQELLLFYAAWPNREVRVLRMPPRIGALIEACDGRSTPASLMRRLNQAVDAGGHESPWNEQDLRATLDKLSALGVLRRAQALAKGTR